MDEPMTTKELIQMRRNGEIAPERYGAYWEDDDRERLRKMYLEGEGITEISIQLQRSESSVFQQLVYWGMFSDSRVPRAKRKASDGCSCAVCTIDDQDRPCYCPHKTEVK